MLMITAMTIVMIMIIDTQVIIKVYLKTIEGTTTTHVVTIDLIMHSSGLVIQTDTNIQTTTDHVRVVKTEPETGREAEVEVEVGAETLAATGITTTTTTATILPCLIEMLIAETKIYQMLDNIATAMRQMMIISTTKKGDSYHSVKCHSVQATNMVLQILIVVLMHHVKTTITNKIQAHSKYVRHSTHHNLQRTVRHLCKQQHKQQQ